MSGGNKKDYDDDDGRTIINMNVDGMPWYNPNARDDKKIPDEDMPTKREMRAMMKAWFAAYVPRILSIVVGFGLAILLIVCWLNGWFLD